MVFYFWWMIRSYFPVHWIMRTQSIGNIEVKDIFHSLYYASHCRRPNTLSAEVIPSRTEVKAVFVNRKTAVLNKLTWAKFFWRISVILLWNWYRLFSSSADWTVFPPKYDFFNVVCVMCMFVCEATEHIL